MKIAGAVNKQFVGQKKVVMSEMILPMKVHSNPNKWYGHDVTEVWLYTTKRYFTITFNNNFNNNNACNNDIL